MFDINKILRNPVTGQFTCSCNTGSSTIATDIQARYLGPVRERFGFTTEIGIQGSTVSIASNSPDITKWIADQINKGYFMPPLDVYVFYGSSQKSLQSRWCVGFDYPQEQVSSIINLLNNGQKPVVADKDSQSWKDSNGNSYSVVMLTGIMDPKPSEELQKRVNLCLNTIRDTTARNLNPITV